MNFVINELTRFPKLQMMQTGYLQKLFPERTHFSEEYEISVVKNRMLY